MSGRIRSIKPELLEDAVTAGVSPNAFRLYVGAILLSDDYGNFRAEPRKLLGDVFWARPEVTIDTVKTLLVELVEAGCSRSQQGLFGLYRVRGQVYGHIRNWEKHQRVDHPGQPRCPKPDDKESESYSPTTAVSVVPRETLAPDQDQDQDQDQDPEQDQDLKRPFGRLTGDGAPVVLVEPVPEPSTLLPPCGSEALTLPFQPESPTRRSPEAEVFAYWVDGWKRIIRGIRVPKLDKKRRSKITARLREGFTVADLKLAIDGMWASDWHVENRRHDLELVCRDASHVESFMGRAEGPPEDVPPSNLAEREPEQSPEDVAMVSQRLQALAARVAGRLAIP